MKTEVFNAVPKFNDKQLDKQLYKQITFLKAIYPFLEDDYWNEGVIELRPIKRDEYLKEYIRSFNTWHLQQKDVEALRKFLGLINGKGLCLYFSGFAFDRNKQVLKKDGNPYQTGKINNENALFTTILPMDFDKCSEDEFLKQKQKLLDLGIETIDIFSGHGFQSFILLNHKVLDKNIYKKFTRLMLSKGFKIDDALVDPARQLRMPYSFNCKALDKSDKYYNPLYPEILPTTDIAWTDKRYHVVDVFEKINSLPDVIVPIDPLTEIDIKSVVTAPLMPSVEKTEKKKKKKEIEEVKAVKIQSLKTIYSSLINVDRLPEAIQKILAGSKDGHRNMVMLFLIPFLRNTLGLNLQTIKQIMVLWGERCTPKLDPDYVVGETERLYSYGLRGKHGKYTAELRQAYGYLEFEEYKRDNKIIIPNAIFEDFDVICDGAIRIYLSMKLAEKIEGIQEFTRKDIQRYAGISERTLDRNIKDLLSMGCVSKRRSKNRRMGEEHIFYLSPYFSTKYGFTTLENSLVRLMLKMLTNGEMKLYSYLCRMIGSGGSSCWASQKHISKKVAKTQQGVSLITDKLMEKGFIKKDTEEKDGVKHSTYNLMY